MSKRGARGQNVAFHAPYACSPLLSRGRFHPRRDASDRDAFQHDRDRILHSTAFRRLTHKTQVFIYHEGDHYRTRLTHTLEVTQIARSIARMLQVNEDLTEALALAHDLGHPPFGHAGESALNDVMKFYGGFDHNAQSLRVVTELERRYAGFDGLNLTWECLEGLVKHNGPLVSRGGVPIGRYAGGDLPYALAAYAPAQDLDLWSFPSLEAQIASLADDIAYDTHDLDDGLRAGFLQIDGMRDVPLFGACLAEVDREHSDADEVRRGHEALRRLTSYLVHDLVNETRRRLFEHMPASADDVRRAPRPMVDFSVRVREEEKSLKAYLTRNVYQNGYVVREMKAADQLVRDLFTAYLSDPDALPREWRVLGESRGEQERARLVCDFVSGMTDRFAFMESRRLFDPSAKLQ